jgi:hypothetical protein
MKLERKVSDATAFPFLPPSFLFHSAFYLFSPSIIVLFHTHFKMGHTDGGECFQEKESAVKEWVGISGFGVVTYPPKSNRCSSNELAQLE